MVEALLDLDLADEPGAASAGSATAGADPTNPARRGVIDRTDHALAVASRPQRTSLRGVVLHRIGDAADAPVAEGRDVEGIIHFFTHDPVGVATVTVNGSWESKVPLIEKWRTEGIPDNNRVRAFVPYTFLIDPQGVISQMLPLQAVGAHAPGYNESGIGVAFIGDFRSEAPSAEQIESGIAVCVALLRQHHLTPQTVKLLGHDEVRRIAKQCPGQNFPLDEICRRVAARFS